MFLLNGVQILGPAAVQVKKLIKLKFRAEKKSGGNLVMFLILIN